MSHDIAPPSRIYNNFTTDHKFMISQEPMNECKITIYFNMFLHHKLHALCFFERFFEKQGKNEEKYTKTKKNETFIKVFDFFSITLQPT